MQRVIAILLVFFCADFASADILFQEGFESGALDAHWSLSSTNDGRAVITTDFAPSTGQRHLVMDDAVNDAIYSVAEATLTLDLSNKKNVVLTFSAKGLGNDPNPPPVGNFIGTRNYDGVAISVDGGTTWRAYSLANIPTDGLSISLSLDTYVAALGGNYGQDVRIRFSEYDNAPAPLDGIALADVVVTADDDQRLVIELPSPLIEGTGPQTGFVGIAIPSDTPITVALFASLPNQLALPATVTIPAGQTSAAFDFSVNDNLAVDLTRQVRVDANAAGATSAAGWVTIFDDEAPTVSLTIPAQLAEGATANGSATLTIDRIASTALALNLTQSPADELTMPTTVTLPAGQTQVVFLVNATDDIRIDGNVAVTVSASAAGIARVNAQTVTIDNEQRTLSFTPPVIIQEGSTAVGTVRISGTLSTPLVVNLASANASALNVPSTVIIPANSTAANFQIGTSDNSIVEGSRNVLVTASADTFNDSSGPITIRDNEVASYRFAPLTDIVNLTGLVNLSIAPLDIEGNVITGISGNLNLFLLSPDGTSVPLAPGSVNWTGGTGWSGSVAIPAVSSSPLRLLAVDSNGGRGESNIFDAMRVLPLAVSDLAWDSVHGRLFATVRATALSPYASSLVAIDPATLQVIASLTTPQEPARLALTDHAEALYVSFAAGTISKVNPATLAEQLSFSVGKDAYARPLYAGDICPVPNQPDTLVISQFVTSVNSYEGVAAYDNGIARPGKLGPASEADIIEPSSDPTILFGYNTRSSEFGFRKLRLDPSGLSQVAIDRTFIGSYSADITSDGNKVFSTTGVAIDGAAMLKLGSFSATGLVRPELVAGRVYFLESIKNPTWTFDKIGAYDAVTLTNVRRLSLPVPVNYAGSLVRWGENGFAFHTADSIVLINSSQLIPSEAPADLAVTVGATASPTAVGNPLVYDVQVHNAGPNVARNAVLTVTLSPEQTLQSTMPVSSVDNGGSVATFFVGDVAVDASVNFTVT